MNVNKKIKTVIPIAKILLTIKKVLPSMEKSLFNNLELSMVF